MPDNLRHAQYGFDTTQVDNPQDLFPPKLYLGNYTWSTLPAPSQVPVGAIAFVTNLNQFSSVELVNRGNYWWPTESIVTLARGASSTVGTPLATVATPSTAFTLSAPILIPANFLKSGMSVGIRALISRTTTAVNTDMRVCLNTSNGNMVNGVVAASTVTGTNTDFQAVGHASFDSATTQFLCEGSFTGYNQATSAGSITTRSTGIDTSADMYVSIGSGTTVGAADTLRLHAYHVWLEV